VWRTKGLRLLRLRPGADSDFTHDAVAWVLHPNNPMGVAAMTLSGGEYAIHGTNKPEPIGKFVSYGCIRMLNQDITDLFARVDVKDRDFSSMRAGESHWP
jgi:L,D-transpeptidase-like protein